MRKGFIAYLVLVIAAFGMTAAYADDEVKAPFVGCPSDGQEGPAPAPANGKAQTIRVSFKLPGPIAFYRGESGIGAFAPAGWHCLALAGANGTTIIVSAHELPTSGMPHGAFDAPVMQLSSFNGETSGRFTVASYSWTLFPDLNKDFVKGVEDEGLLPKSDIEIPKSPTDHVTYLNPRLVLFETPANMEGLGTGSYVRTGLTPITGLVALSDDGLSLSILRMSLGKQDDAWSKVLMMLDTPCVTGNAACQGGDGSH